MIRLWWFCLWLWEWFWNPQGMLPWAEANQGMLSIGALLLAIGVAWFEHRRARDLEMAETKRANEAMAKAKDEARRFEEEQYSSFARACLGIISNAEGTIEAEVRRLKAAVASGGAYEGLNREVISAAESAGRSLLPLLPTGRDPLLIIAVQQASDVLQRTDRLDTTYHPQNHLDWWNARLEELEKARKALNDRWAVLVDPRKF